MTDDLTPDNSVDIRPWPSIELVGRAVALSTVARRGALEVDDSADEFELETDRFDLSTWARTELLNWITDSEIRLLEKPIGKLSDDDLQAADDALMSATAIAWAVRAIDAEHLPLPEQTELDAQTLLWSPNAWGKVRPLAQQARVRSDEELALERERWELWYWRATDGLDDPDGVAEVAREVADSELIDVVQDDFADDNGTPFHRLQPEQQDDVAWIAECRLRALNWACGLGDSWDTTALYIDD